MGDIAFLLLIFFVILARVQDDSHVRWQPAKAEELTPAGAAVASVAIDQDSLLYLNGKRVGSEQLAGSLQSLLGDNPAGKRTILLKVHKEALAKDFEPAIEAISIAGGELVHILESAPEQMPTKP